MTGASDLERLVVERSVAGFMAFSRQERLRLYRLHLQTAVDRISPVALDLAVHGGFGIDETVRRLPVPEGWPAKSVAPAAGITAVTWMALGRQALRRTVARRQMASRLEREGVLMRGHGDPLGELGYAVFQGELEAVTRLGDCVLHTRRGVCRLLLSRSLPETIADSLVGKPIGDLVEHPVLSGRRYRILSVQNHGRAGGSVVVFATGSRPLELPWRAELLAEMERDA